MRYARPHCDECVRLAAESSALFLEHSAASEQFRMTPQNDRTYVEKRKRVEKLIGQLREARRREDLHEETHQDEFSN